MKELKEMKKVGKDSLTKIKKEVAECKKCRLWKKATKSVPGEGPAKASIFFVGMAPGKEEDKSGKPFVGRAGKFLDELLKKAGIKRKKVFITSVVKHFPPKNRKPKKDEIKACLPFLCRQIKLVNPKLIVLLGNTALESLTSFKKAGQHHGNILKEQGWTYFVSFHPAAGMRFPKIKKKMLSDFRKLKRAKKVVDLD